MPVHASDRSPFDPANAVAYRRWREYKLAASPDSIDELMVEIRDPHRLSQAEKAALQRCCRRANMAFYTVAVPQSVDKQAIHALSAQLGLDRLAGNLCADEDRITSLRVQANALNSGYIPYTNRALNWHTDGYYNPPAQRIRAFLMHCQSAAAEGGMNTYFDHELVYILLRDQDPAYIHALMQPDIMTLPANIEQGREIRPEQSGPVFEVESGSGNLQMRYTARERNIIWRSDPVTQAARTRLLEILASPRAAALSHCLQPGQGIVCNNVLHNRTAFTDDAEHPRLLYRARFHNRIAGTDLQTPLTLNHGVTPCWP